MRRALAVAAGSRKAASAQGIQEYAAMPTCRPSASPCSTFFGYSFIYSLACVRRRYISAMVRDRGKCVIIGMYEYRNKTMEEVPWRSRWRSPIGGWSRASRGGDGLDSLHVDHFTTIEDAQHVSPFLCWWPCSTGRGSICRELVSRRVDGHQLPCRNLSLSTILGGIN